MILGQSAVFHYAKPIGGHATSPKQSINFIAANTPWLLVGATMMIDMFGRVARRMDSGGMRSYKRD